MGIKKRLIGISLLATTLSACATRVSVPSPDPSVEPAGFLSGVWNGFTLPVTFLASMIGSDIAIYDVVNTGRGYDFGFVLGIMLFLAWWKG